MMDGGTTTQAQDLAYDLRQIYARIVGEHLQDIAEARKNEKFYIWFKNLEDLHTIVKHKFKKKKEDKQDPEKVYQNKKAALVKLANDHQNVWVGASTEPIAFALIETALREIEMFLYDKMNDAKMFGQSGHVAGL